MLTLKQKSTCVLKRGNNEKYRKLLYQIENNIVEKYQQ